MRTFLIAFILITSFSTPLFVSAQTVLSTDTSAKVVLPTNTTPSPNSSVTLSNPLKAKNLQEFLGQILEFVIRIGTVVVVLMIVYVGFKFVTAQGNDSKISEAKEMLLWTVVGALILLGAQVIASGISATVNALKGP
jgi:heme/copper-type cytochrome/quinol oxidase subunit 2